MNSNQEEIVVKLSLKDNKIFAADARMAAASVRDIGVAADEANLASRKSAGGLGMLSGAAGGLATAAKYSVYATGALALGLTGATTAATFFGLKAASGFEQAQIAFTTMLGSSDKATAFMSQLKNFAATTPFDFADLVPDAQRLMAFGFQSDQVLSTLTAIGDAASGLDAGKEGIDRITVALGQMKSSGTVHSQDINQLIQAGIPAWQMLADAAHKSVAQIMKDVESGLVPGPQAVGVLVAGMESRYKGLMDKESHTLGGLLSNLHDRIQQNLAVAVQPAMTILERDLPKATDLAGVATKKFGNVLNQMVVGVTHLVQPTKDFVNALKSGNLDRAAWAFDRFFGGTGALVEPFKIVVNFAIQLWRTFTQLLSPIMMQLGRDVLPIFFGGLMTAANVLKLAADNAEIVGPALYGLIAAFGVYRTITALTRAWSAAQAALNFVMEMNPIVLAVTLVIGLGAAIYYAYRHSERFRESVSMLWFGLQVFWTFGVAAWIAVGNAIGATARLGSEFEYWILGLPIRLTLALIHLWDPFRDSWRAAMNFVIGGWNSLKFTVPKISLPGLPDFGGFTVGVPSIPYLYQGGVAQTPGLAWVADRGPELIQMMPGATVTPLSQDQKSASLRSVVFEDGSIRISGTDVLNNKRVADILVETIQNRLART